LAGFKYDLMMIRDSGLPFWATLYPVYPKTLSISAQTNCSNTSQF